MILAVNGIQVWYYKIFTAPFQHPVIAITPFEKLQLIAGSIYGIPFAFVFVCIDGLVNTLSVFVVFDKHVTPRRIVVVPHHPSLVHQCTAALPIPSSQLTLVARCHCSSRYHHPTSSCCCICREPGQC